MAIDIKRLIRFSDDEAARLMIFYSEAEREILTELNRALLTPNEKAYLETMHHNVGVILQDLETGSKTWCGEAIPRVYMQGSLSADEQVKRLGRKALTGFGAIHQQAVQVLADNAFQRLQDVVQVIGRREADIYRTMALESIRGSVVGYQTWQDAAARFKQSLAERGITGFVDKSNREWNMSTYADMVARTSTMESHLQGTANRLLEHGLDLVQISTHSDPCDMCEPWQGEIVSLTGKTPGYPTMAEAKDAGLWHPNCRHSFGAYIPELN